MKKILFASLLMIPCISTIKVNALEGNSTSNEKHIYASPTGTFQGDGSQSNPYNIQEAVYNASPGATIHVMEGTYNLNGRILASGINGSEKQPIKLLAEGDVTLDYSNMFDSEIPSGNYMKKYSTVTGYTEGDAQTRGLVIESDYWYVNGFKILNAGDNGIYIGGNHNTIENCITTGCRDTGIQLGRNGSNDISISSWPSYNTILNCTSYNNDDYTGENADGFACKLTTGVGNVFDGCISYNNSDDGWDLYTKNATDYEDIMIGAVTIKNCIAFNHGRTTNGSSKSAGDGNGFKLGGEKINGNHIIENCISFNNTCHGFTDNSNPGTITVKNCTGYNNGISPEETKSNFDFARHDFENDSNSSGLTSNNYFVNNLSFSEITQNKNIHNEMVDVIAIPDKYLGTAENTLFSRYGYLFKFTEPEVCNHNSASTRGAKVNTTFTGTDIFESTTLPFDVKTNPDIVHTAWRNEDGSINMGSFLKIKTSFNTTVGMTNIGANLHK